MDIYLNASPPTHCDFIGHTLLQAQMEVILRSRMCPAIQSSPPLGMSLSLLMCLHPHVPHTINFTGLVAHWTTTSKNSPLGSVQDNQVMLFVAINMYFCLLFPPYCYGQTRYIFSMYKARSCCATLAVPNPAGHTLHAASLCWALNSNQILPEHFCA